MMTPQPVRQIEDFRELGVPHNRRDGMALIAKFVALYFGLALLLALLIVFAPLIVQAIRGLFS